MPNVLLSGPAGSNKSALARQLIQENPLMVAADFQALYVALTLAVRDADGRYPPRNDDLLPLTEYLRRAVIGAARQRNVDLVVTNSDGSPERRSFLLAEMGAGAVERIVDPGEAVVAARLADPVTGELSEDCSQAIGRWFRRR